MQIGEYLSASQKKRAIRRRRFLYAFYVFLGCVFLFGISWLIFLSPVFKVRNIVVQGSSSVSNQDVINLIYSTFKEKHNFIDSLLGANNILALPSKISSSDMSSVPDLLNIKISKNYFTREVSITVKERDQFAVWCFMPKGFNVGSNDISNASGTIVNQESDERCYWFDDSGFLFKEGFDSEGGVLMAIHDYSQSPNSIGNFILSQQRFIPNMISIINLLRNSGLNIKEVRLNDIGLEEIQVKTYNGPDIYFSLRFAPDVCLGPLENIMSLPNFSALQYIDFRTQNRVYYR
jgi:hypothetical protein